MSPCGLVSSVTQAYPSVPSLTNCPMVSEPFSRPTVEEIDWVEVLIVAMTSPGKPRPTSTASTSWLSGDMPMDCTRPVPFEGLAGRNGLDHRMGGQADHRDTATAPGVGHVQVARAAGDGEGDRSVADGDRRRRCAATSLRRRVAGRGVEVLDPAVAAVRDVDEAVGGVDRQGRGSRGGQQVDRCLPGVRRCVVHRDGSVAAVPHVERGPVHGQRCRRGEVATRGDRRR